MDGVARAERLTILGSQRVNLIDSTVYRLRASPGADLNAVIARLGRTAGVAFAQPDYRYALAQAAPASPAAPAMTSATISQYALEKLDIARAHVLTRGRSAVVAVIDSAVDRTNPSLKAAQIDAVDAIAPQPPDRHGTGMAGAIAASGLLTGVAPEAKIVAITAFASKSQAESAAGATFALLYALDLAVAKRARIVNMSFAGPADPLLARAIARAQLTGVIFVAAAGNEGPKAPPQYPAADPGVVAVGATDASDHPYAQENRGDYVAVSAPGVDVLAAAPGGYDMTTGTSVAAAEVSGVAALMLDAQPALSAAALRAALVRSAQGRASPAREFGVAPGPVDAERAILAVRPPQKTSSIDRGTGPQPEGIERKRDFSNF